jgi:hypothetical protein
VEEGLYFLVDVEIVLALRGGTKVCAWQEKRRGRGEVRAERFHGLQGVWSAAKDVSSERGEVFETSPHLQDCVKRGETKMSEMSTPPTVCLRP